MPARQRSIDAQNFSRLTNVARDIGIDRPRLWIDGLAPPGQVLQPELHRMATRHRRKLVHLRFRRET